MIITYNQIRNNIGGNKHDKDFSVNLQRYAYFLNNERRVLDKNEISNIMEGYYIL